MWYCVSIGCLSVITYYLKEIVLLKNHQTDMIKHQITHHLIQIEIIYCHQWTFGHSQIFLRFTVDCIPCYATEAIYDQNLHKFSLFFQWLYSLLISVVKESLISFLTFFWPGIIEYIKDRLVLHLIVPLNWLAVEPGSYLKCEYHLKGNTRELKGFIITDKSDNVRDHTENEIVIYKKDIGFFKEKLSHLLNNKNNFSFTVIFTSVMIWSSSSKVEVSEQFHQSFYLII